MNYGKQILSFILLGAASAASAMPGAGTYLGMSTGYAWAKAKSNSTLTQQKNDNVAFGLFAGQKITRYISVELAANKVANLNYGLSGGQSVTLKFYDADALLVNRLPISDKLSAFIKFGASYILEKATGHLSGTETAAFGSRHFIRPKVAIGAQFALNENFAVDASYSRIFGMHNVGDDNYLPNLDMAAVGFSYCL